MALRYDTVTGDDPLSGVNRTVAVVELGSRSTVWSRS
jgi:hypothetical protein